jgi:hypothetical protein
MYILLVGCFTGWVLVVPACTLPIQITFANAFKLIEIMILRAMKKKY